MVNYVLQIGLGHGEGVEVGTTLEEVNGVYDAHDARMQWNDGASVDPAPRWWNIKGSTRSGKVTRTRVNLDLVTHINAAEIAVESPLAPQRPVLERS